MTLAQDHAADIAACRNLLRDGSRTFYAASLVLPRRVANPAIALYAFCRLADDAVDLGQDRKAAVTRLEQRLDAVYRGHPMPHAADRAFSEVVARYAIPRDIPAALLEGLAWDAKSRRYETLNELYDYAARVAGTVGAMMSLIMGRRAPDIVARACDLGCAMQLTNIARDVGEDARAGRLYLPLQWMRDAGINPDSWLKHPVFDRCIAAIVQRLLDAADGLYHRSGFGIAHLPMSCRPGMYAARALYGEIGREVERAQLNSISSRAVVSGRRKLGVLARTLMSVDKSWGRPGDVIHGDAPLLATQFLVDAVAATPLRDGVSAATVRRRSVEERLVWVIELFERLERRDQLQRSRV